VSAASENVQKAIGILMLRRKEKGTKSTEFF
jgi:hypothetical protein